MTALPPLRRSIIGQALADARRIEDAHSRCLTLVALWSTLPVGEAAQLDALLKDIDGVDFVLHVGELWLQIAKHLPGTRLVDAGIEAIQRTRDNRHRVNTLIREVSTLPSLQVRRSFRCAGSR